MKISKDTKILALTALLSATALFVAVTKNLNAGQGYYGDYRNDGYDPRYPRPTPPAYQYYAPGMPPDMRGYSAAPRYNSAPQPSIDSRASVPAAESVAINGMQFQPATIRVKAGEEVSWTNNAAMPHTVTGRDDGNLASQRLNQGSVFSHTFEQPGTYNYYCALHPSMTGVVIVEQ